jgi:hypothetical protein
MKMNKPPSLNEVFDRLKENKQRKEISKFVFLLMLLLRNFLSRDFFRL